jgi:25S rRNA (adenine2142-N1)-methyltransferase
MPKVRRRKLPVTSFESQKPSSSTSQSSRTIIRRFHLLLKRRSQLQNSQTQDAGEYSQALGDIEDEIAHLGGLERYQRMSAVGQGKDRGGGSEEILIKWLKDLGLDDLKTRQAKLRYALW